LTSSRSIFEISNNNVGGIMNPNQEESLNPRHTLHTANFLDS